MADKIIAKLVICNPNWIGSSEADIRDCLEALCEGIIEEIQINGSIVMSDGDFQLLPGLYKDGANLSLTGEGDNKAFDLTGKIQ